MFLSSATKINQQAMTGSGENLMGTCSPVFGSLTVIISVCVLSLDMTQLFGCSQFKPLHPHFSVYQSFLTIIIFNMMWSIKTTENEVVC